MDKEIAASGYLREVQEFNKELRVGQVTQETDEDEGSESDDEEDDNTTETAENEEEITELKVQTENLCRDLKEEVSINNVCEDLEDQSLEPVAEDDEEDPKTQDPVKEVEEDGSEEESKPENCPRKKGKEMDSAARMALIKQLARARELRQKAEENGDETLLDDLMGDSVSDICSVRSFSTTASTISPSTVKHRTQKDLTKREKKQVSKKNMRVKGEANAFNRQKKENVATIRDSAGWDDY